MSGELKDSAGGLDFHWKTMAEALRLDQGRHQVRKWLRRALRPYGDDPAYVTARRLATLQGSTSQAFVEGLIPEAQLTTVPDYDAGVQLVLEDKVHALVADYPICVLSVLRHADKGLVPLAAPLTIEPIGVALPAGDSLLLNLVENHLGALDALGILDELEVMWFEDSSWLIHLP